MLFHDVILGLPNLVPDSEESTNLLKTLLNEAVITFDEEVDTKQMPQTSSLLALALHLVCERRLASPVPIVYFWCPHRVIKIAEDSYDNDLQLDCLEQLVAIYTTVQSRFSAESAELRDVRVMLVNVSTELISVSVANFIHFMISCATHTA